MPAIEVTMDSVVPSQSSASWISCSLERLRYCSTLTPELARSVAKSLMSLPIPVMAFVRTGLARATSRRLEAEPLAAPAWL